MCLLPQLVVFVWIAGRDGQLCKTHEDKEVGRLRVHRLKLSRHSVGFTNS
jgi:hypothetical protein